MVQTRWISTGPPFFVATMGKPWAAACKVKRAYDEFVEELKSEVWKIVNTRRENNLN